MRALFEFEGRPLLFEKPLKVIACYSAAGLVASFDQMEEAVRSGCYVCGFLSYEAGFAFESSLSDLPSGRFPLLVMGVFSAPVPSRPVPPGLPVEVTDFEPGLSREDYTRDIAVIHDHIIDGDVYQITYALKYYFKYRGSSYDLYRRLLREQLVPYPAYLEVDDFKILSLSPEMFLRKRGTEIITKPMKGSWPRGQGFMRDLIGGALLSLDPKNRSENVMIADLLRNDLGRLGRGVHVPRLFEVARYRTIYQMTSTVCAHIAADLSFYDIFRAIFPSGSVTGAPKVTAMRIIQGLECCERKIYTGAIGWITPERDMFFNVPIRTLLLQGGQGEMGVGGGIVWDSTADGEWSEVLWKSRFLSGFSGRRQG